MKKVLMISLVLFMGIALVACGDKNSDVIEIGIIQYAEHPALDQSTEGFIAALKDEGFVDGQKIRIEFKNSQADQANSETIADKFVNDKKDLIYAIATPAAQAVAQKTQDIPIVISAVTNPENSGLVDSNAHPGGNVTGVSDLTPVKEQVALLVELLPNVKKVAVMYTNSEDNSRYQADLAKAALDAVGIQWVEATVSDISQIQQVAESLVGKVDAIYIPTDNLMAEGISTITMVATNQGIPCIVGEVGMVEGGGLATVGIDYYNIGYLAGLQAAKILRGESVPADMPIEYLGEEEREIVINKAVADELGITIPDSLVQKATIRE